MTIHHTHTQSITQCLKVLGSGVDGLSAIDVQSRLIEHGKNCLPEAKPPAMWQVFIHQFMSPLIYILLVAGVVTIVMEEYFDAAFIFTVLLVNAAIGTAQEHSANHAAAALKKMVTSLARVKRDGTIQEIDASELVPGDVVLLETGNKVPADMRLMDTSSLKIDESLLTGEFEAVRKQADITLEKDVPTGDRVNMAFAGSMVTHGRAVGVIVATGLHTKIGEIAKQIIGKTRIQSPLIIRMERFTMQVALLTGVMLTLISGLLYMQGHTFEHIFLIAVGMAVAVIPEGMPITVTVALAIGMKRMAERNVIVRRLVAVESLGSCTLIAADKTGTLTRNELNVERLVLPSKEHFTITSGSAVADGRIFRSAHS